MTNVTLWYIIACGGGYMARQACNVTLEPGVLDEFCKYAGPKGIRISAWVNAKMKEFIEEEKQAETAKLAAKKGRS
jgi:hypothetical protein